MKLMSYAAVAALFTFATTATAHEYKVGDLVVDHPMAFETAQTAQTAGGFMTITNTGSADDRLIAVEADFPRIEIHTTEMDGDVARMMHLEDGIVVPAGESVTLQPGGLHVMFMGLGGDPFEVDEEVPATLVFEEAGRLDVIFHVEERKMDGHGEMDHGEMDHSGH
ncbi:copper chaperone PCu(A)C [Yoonia sp. GPGPB17]|uniref:copper chaperone PCu(A)C n=1 Tax=Yoonia sp. GPGPB17 TaxID=3026147 RepID=UPI0030C1B445